MNVVLSSMQAMAGLYLEVPLNEKLSKYITGVQLYTEDQYDKMLRK
jgi:hypothetical protein